MLNGSYRSSSFKAEEKTEPQEIPHGGVAQLGEHLPCKQGVMGSNPIISTRPAEPAGKVEAAKSGPEFSTTMGKQDGKQGAAGRCKG